MAAPAAPAAPLFAQDQYLSEIRHTAPLAPDAEVLYLMVCRRDADARERLVVAYQPLVLNVARRYLRRDAAMDLMDLVQEGNIGLLTALDQYDLSLGTAFSTLAFTCIRAAITAALWQGDGLIRLPDHKARALRRLDQIEAALCVSLGRDPAVAELAAALACKVADVRELMVLRARQICSLDAPLGDGTDTPIADIVAEVLARPQGKAALLVDAIASLSEMEQTLLRERFGADGGDVTPRRVVAERMGLMPRDVERLEQTAQRKIARYLAYVAA
ncbi:MAG: sigma-70 family RNA polymerase sigma factor [Ktedonobacterales bacterium]|nr:sigma-70 family RNA polymerase sigma factor [Ktedonobacterales bacterium]